MDSHDSLDDKTLAFVGVGRKAGQGRFTLERLLGQGAMGAVWLAVDARLSERVALKFVPQAVRHDPAALDGLRREAQRSHRLTHPNIVRIHDFHEPPGEEPFISMEFVEGRTFSEWRWTEPQKCLSWEKLSPLVRQLCEALGYAHGEGVVHRDLKPANLMLDTKGRLKLADFGLATVIHESLSKASGHTVMGGTPAYMSPQQVTGKAPGVADDIYSLGVTLYELLTSHPPFFRGDISYQAVNETPLPMREQQLEFGVRNPVPSHVEQVIMSCLEKDPARRPPGALQIAERLYGEPSSNPNVAPGRRGGRGWLKIATASLCVLLVVGAYFWFHGNRREEAKSGMDQNLAAPDASSEDGKTRPAGQTGAIPEFLAPETGFESIFNGKDLSGWNGDSNVWSVRDGVIVASTNGGSGKWAASYLYWHETNLDNFELRFSCRRGERSNISGRVAFGTESEVEWTWPPYQIGLWPLSVGEEFIWLKGAPSVHVGDRVVIGVDGKESRTALWLANSYTPCWNTNLLFWNETAVTVQGGHLLVRLNGEPIAELVDEQWETRREGSQIALGVEMEPAFQGEVDFMIKNVRLKRLNGPDSSGH
jgi:serine/threonine protein kinase